MNEGARYVISWVAGRGYRYFPILDAPTLAVLEQHRRVQAHLVRLRRHPGWLTEYMGRN